MAEVLIYGIVAIVVLKFAWDHLILPVIDNLLGIRMALKAQPPKEETNAFGFHMPWHDDPDDYEEDEE